MVAAARRMSAPDRPDGDLEHVDQQCRQRSVERRGDAHERRLEPLVAECGLPARHRIGGEPDRPDEHGHEHDEADGGEERARQRAAGLRRLLGQVRDRLEPRVREHRQREREREIGPLLAAGELEAVAERLRREHEREPDQHENGLDGEVEHRDDHPAHVQLRPTDDPHGRDRTDDRAPDGHVPGSLAQRRRAEGRAEIVRHEERRERHHDEEVEEQHPAGGEPEHVRERAPHEGCGSTGFGNRRGSLGVGQRDEDEDRARQEEDERRESERRRRDDPERDVERRRDLPVRDGEERRSVEDAFEPSQLAGH